MFEKILIANRGEIALRIIKTCRRLGIPTVAIYSDADQLSPHVQLADEAISIGGYTPLESYLVIDKILAAASSTGADAIHPGYGFLSENAGFARAVGDSNITFIGPTAKAINLLGDKTKARRLAIGAGVPVSPGSDGEVDTLSDARKIAKKTGYPLMIKAAAGGGGKGMRVVNTSDELEQAFMSAQNESMAAFSDARVFVERYIRNPRHIEIQILADHHGKVLYFPERECSIQRRHQKVIEESPSTAVSPELRKSMGEAAAQLISDAGYTNAGTIEFLLDEESRFYFMEVNTRLQVEHPVTEAVSNVDFVEQQIIIAAGLPLELTQTEITANGHAIECRICAEDVYGEFLPDVGTITYLSSPEGEGIRNDSALYVGYEVSVHYDPMVAKLIVWSHDRSTCIERTVNALDNYHIGGIRTTIPFCRSVLDSKHFRSGDYTTKYIEQHWTGERPLEIKNLFAASAIFGHHEFIQRRMLTADDKRND